MIKCPCAGECPDRWAECHSSCRAYKAYRALKNEELKEKAKQTALDDVEARAAGRMVKLRKHGKLGVKGLK